MKIFKWLKHQLKKEDARMSKEVRAHGTTTRKTTQRKSEQEKQIEIFPGSGRGPNSMTLTP